jgi:hypothetical protein
MKGTSAYRSPARALDPMEMSVPEEELAEDVQEDEELQVFADIDDLKNHPGYQTIKKTREDLIRQYKSGEFLKDAVKDPLVTNERLGELLRAGWMAADALEREVSVEILANEAVEQEKAKRRERRATQPKGDK